MATLQVKHDAVTRTFDLGPLGKQRLKGGDRLHVPDDAVDGVKAALGKVESGLIRWVGRAVRRAAREVVEEAGELIEKVGDAVEAVIDDLTDGKPSAKRKRRAEPEAE